MASRTELASKNIAVNLVSRLATIVLDLVARAVFVQILGAELLGVSAVFSSMIAVLSIAELGLTNIMLYSYYEPLARDDHHKLAALVNFYKKLFRAIAVFIAIIGIGLMPFLPLFINGDGSVGDLYGVYLLFVADASISYLMVYRVIILRADQRGFIVTAYDIIIHVIRVVVQILVLFATGSFFLYVLTKSVATFTLNVISTLRARKDYPYALDKTARLDLAERREVITTIGSGFLYRFSAVVMNNTTNIVMSIMVGTLMVGYVGNYTTIISAVTAIIAMLFTSLTPSIGNLAILGTGEQRLELFNVMQFAGSWLAVVFVSCTTLLSNDFIGLWLGHEYIMGDVTVALKMLLMFFACVMQPVFIYREAVGLYRQTKYIMVVAAILNLAFSVAFGCFWGLNGILAASPLAILLTYFWFEPKVLFQMYFTESPISYFKGFALALTGTAAFVVAGHFALDWIAIDSWLMFIVKGVAFFVLSNVACYIVLRKRPEFEYIKNKMVLIKGRLLRNDG